MSRRSSLQIMLSVWKALLLREATYRLFGTRGAWAWLLIEPLTWLNLMGSELYDIRKIAGMEETKRLVIKMH